MRAVIYEKYGSPDVLRLAKVDKPTPKADEVLVKVMATAVNQADNHLLSGSLRFQSGLRKPKVLVLGSDIAGVVEAIGPAVTEFAVGDAVFGDLSEQGRGGFAEYVAVSEGALARMPAQLTFAQAAAVPMTAVTALQGLRDKGELQPGEQVLINGASGGVGTFAVQIAKVLGGEVTAVCSTHKMEMMRALGADHLIDYTREDFTQSERRYDLIFDTVGNYSVAAYREALKAGGRFVTTAFLPALLLLSFWIARTEGKKMVNLMAKPNKKDLTLLAEWLEAGKVKAVIDRCYSLDETAEALRYLGKGRAKGKVIITMESPDAGCTPTVASNLRSQTVRF